MSTQRLETIEKYAKEINTFGRESDMAKILTELRCACIFDMGITLGEKFILLFPNNYTMLTELGLCYYYCEDSSVLNQNKQKAYDIFSRIKNVPYDTYTTNEFNKAHCIPFISGEEIPYDKDLVNSILNNLNSKTGTRLITLTMTTCKRFDLFFQTVCSFMKSCTDIFLIDDFVCIDDNSTEEDREKMMKLFPFFKFILKGKQDKGHPQSLNILLEHVKTPYIFHLEDDWKFFGKRTYITDCLDVLSNQEKDSKAKHYCKEYGQCLLNKNYIETTPDMFNVVGGFPKVTKNGVRYLEHEYCSTEEEYNSFYNKYGRKPNSAYWPHYSLRPGLNKREIFTETDPLSDRKDVPFDTKVSHFERKYTERYVQNYSTVFLDTICCLHTGRLTSEINDKTKLNAYALNGEYQFAGKEEALSTVGSTSHDQKNALSEPLKIKTFMINLDRRPDRWEKMERIDFGVKINRFSAIDGSKLKVTPQIERLFDNNDYMMRKGMVGCAMSHLLLITQLVNDPLNDAYVILEDDIEPIKNEVGSFWGNVEKVLLTIDSNGVNFDLVYLGHHLKKQFVPDTLPSEFTVNKWSTEKSLTESLGGTGGYIISKNGAKKLLDFINKTGMTNGIDTVQQKSANTLDVYYVYPHLFTSECWTGDNNPDTDIQHCYDYLQRDVKDRLTDELVFYKNDPVQTFSGFNTFVKLIQAEEVGLLGLEKKKGDIQTKICFYTGTDKDEIRIIKKECDSRKIKNYTLNDEILVTVPEELYERYKELRFFNRVKKGDVYDVSSCVV